MIIWKKIENFNYEVSNTGNVRKIGKLSNLAFSVNKKTFTSYTRVTLFKENTRNYYQVHRLVAKAFIPNPKNLPQVNHKDNNGLNNSVENLEWCTAKENIQHSFKMDKENKLKICSKGGIRGGKTQQENSIKKYKEMLGNRFLGFYPVNTIYTKSAVIAYKCYCGIERKASIFWKELRVHKGKCPECTNTVNRSNKSL